MLLQATSPVRLPGTLARAVRQFAENGKDSMVGVIPIGPFIWTWHADGVAHRGVRDYGSSAPPGTDQGNLRYRENGSMYITKTHVHWTTTTAWRATPAVPLTCSCWTRSRASTSTRRLTSPWQSTSSLRSLAEGSNLHPQQYSSAAPGLTGTQAFNKHSNKRSKS